MEENKVFVEIGNKIIIKDKYPGRFNRLGFIAFGKYFGELRTVEQINHKRVENPLLNWPLSWKTKEKRTCGFR